MYVLGESRRCYFMKIPLCGPRGMKEDIRGLADRAPFGFVEVLLSLRSWLT